jgi:initiation factor 1A
MVKNTTGGTKTKGLARKHQRHGDEKLRLPDDALEQIACVTKMLGNGMCEIYTEENERLIGHIRSKFRGKQKRHNLISTSTVVLIGLREWENPIKNCDILTIYNDSQIRQLKNMPNLQMENIMRIRNDLSHMGTTVSTDDFEFSNMVEDEEDEEEAPQNTMKSGETFTLGNMGNVDVDDI